MNSGWPAGATASSRAEAGEARPASRRAWSRRPPTAPATAISALIEDTALQAAVASMNASAASDAGVPAPAGSFISEGAQPAANSTSAAAAVPAPRRTYFFPTFCLAPRIFLSISVRLMESPSPPSARVHAAMASS